MAVFAYTALASDGKQTSGTIPAESRSAALAAVMSRGLHPVSIQEQAASGKKAAVENKHPNGGKVTPKHVESFTRELANLLAGGVPLARSLHLLRRETKAPGPRALWTEIHDDVVGGQSLADSLAAHPKVFSPVYIAMIRAGEAGGFLDVVLGQIAEFRTREQDLKGKVKAALVYPCVLATLATGVMAFLLMFFIPQFSKMFADVGSALPYLTQLILLASKLVTKYGPFVAVAVIVAIIVLRRVAGTDRGKREIEKLILRTPALGSVVSHFALVRFSRMLGTLLAAGVPLVSSLKVAKEAIGNQTLADAVASGIEEVQRGESLARALGTAEQLFPSSVIEMIAIAEETGRLDKELVRLSVSYESELDRHLRMLVALAEPMLLFVMAGMIGTIVIGMLLPIFNLQELIK